MTKKIDVDTAPTVVGSRYPSPYDQICAGRFRRRAGEVAGLTQFGVNLTRLPPGCWSSQRHWHTAEDEFIFVGLRASERRAVPWHQATKSRDGREVNVDLGRRGSRMSSDGGDWGIV